MLRLDVVVFVLAIAIILLGLGDVQRAEKIKDLEDKVSELMRENPDAEG